MKTEFARKHCFKAIVSVLVILCLLFSLVYVLCKDPLSASDMSEKVLIFRIEEDYDKYCRKNLKGYDPKIDRASVHYYYGTFDECVPVIFGLISADVLTQEKIEDATLYYSDSNHIKVWENGNFHSLNDAYELGLLTLDEIREIAYIHNNGMYKNVIRPS